MTFSLLPPALFVLQKTLQVPQGVCKSDLLSFVVGEKGRKSEVRIFRIHPEGCKSPPLSFFDLAKRCDSWTKTFLLLQECGHSYTAGFLLWQEGEKSSGKSFLHLEVGFNSSPLSFFELGEALNSRGREKIKAKDGRDSLRDRKGWGAEGKRENRGSGHNPDVASHTGASRSGGVVDTVVVVVTSGAEGKAFGSTSAGRGDGRFFFTLSFQGVTCKRSVKLHRLTDLDLDALR